MAQHGPGIPTRSHITAVKREIVIRRSPVILVHGLWSAMSVWGDAFKRNDPGWVVGDDFDYANSVAVDRSAPELDGRINELLNSMKSGAATGGRKIASTKVDLIAHSLGGVVSRKLLSLPGYRAPSNFNKGKVRKFISLASPHRGTQIANLIINLHDEFADPLTGDHSAGLKALEILTGLPPSRGNFHQGALCDLAEGSAAMDYPSVSDLKTYALTGSKGPIGELGGANSLIPGFFSSAQVAEHVTPYVFDDLNDTQVAVDSQNHNGNIYSTNNSNLDHSAIKNDSETSDLAFALLDRSGVVASGLTNRMPANLSNSQGIPRPFVGRGIDPVANDYYDAINYRRQCTVGGPMNRFAP